MGAVNSFKYCLHLVLATWRNVPSRVSSARVLVISNIGLLTWYLLKVSASNGRGATVSTKGQVKAIPLTKFLPNRCLFYLLFLYLFRLTPHNSHNSVSSSPPMSPMNVSLQVGLVKRNHLRHRYQMPFAGLLAHILPPFSQPLVN
ncbi:unnamed protein product [Protopolystoma xenopodis]|uniref:Uncharacterized protein n=1 Tax=Protopolystoma xenopodis TaxID=117903 RepID=A0A3S4ZMU4_9PLAT|nr:unnamed protein product [Protopolystoma xenopodis]